MQLYNSYSLNTVNLVLMDKANVVFALLLITAILAYIEFWTTADFPHVINVMRAHYYNYSHRQHTDIWKDYILQEI